MNNEFQNGGMPVNDPNMMPQQPMGAQQPVPQQPVQQPVQPVQQPMPQQPMMNQQPMMQQQPMMNQQPMQQPAQPAFGGMPQQPVQQPMPQPMGFGGQPTSPAKNNKLPLIIVAGVAGIIVFALLISIVSTKTLKCSDSETSDGLTMKETTEAKFKFGKIKTYKKELVLDFSDVDEEYEEYIDELVESLEEKNKEECKKGCSLKTSNKNKVLKITLTVKSNADNFKKLTGFSSSKSYKDLKEDEEDDGLTCK